MRKYLSFFGLSALLFGANFLLPNQVMGQISVAGGDLAITNLPESITLAARTTSHLGSNTTYSYLNTTAGTADSPQTLLSIQDLRDGADGSGFIVTAEVLSCLDGIGNPCDGGLSANGASNIYIATQAPSTGSITAVNGVGYDNGGTGPQTVSAPLDLNGADAGNFANYVTSMDSPVTILDGTLDSNSGRVSQMHVAVNYGFYLRPFSVPGLQTATIQYTILDSTNDGGGEGGGDLSPDPFDSSDDVSAGATFLPPASGQAFTWGDHTLSPTDQTDWFAVDLVNSPLTITPTADQGAVTITMFESDGTTAVPGNNPATPGRYLLRVQSDPVGSNADYRFSYNYAGAHPDASDTGDDTCGAGATSLTPIATEQRHGPHTLTATDSADWFQMDLSGGGPVDLNTIVSNGAMKINAYLNGCTPGDLVFSNTIDGGNDQFFDLRLEDFIFGTYYFEVLSEPPNETRAYNLYYSLTATATGEKADDSFDHGTSGGDDYSNNATNLTITGSSQSHTNHKLTPTDVADWYTMSLATDNYNFTADNVIGDLQATIYDSGLSQQAVSTNTLGAFNLDFTPASAGDYYLKVEVNTNPVPRNNIAAYDLTYINNSGSGGGGGGGDTHEPDNNNANPQDASLASLLVMTTNSQTSATHTLTASDQYDWFAFDLTAGQEYTINTTGADDTTCELYSDIAGTTVVNNPSGDDDAGAGLNCSTTYTAASTARYYFRVHHYTVGNNASYDLAYIETAGGGGDAYEPNNTGAEATAITLATPDATVVQTSTNHTLSVADTLDVFAITLTAGKTYNFNSLSTANGNLYAKLYSDVGLATLVMEDQGSSHSSNQFNLNYTAATTGTYYLAVNEESTGPGDYTLSFREIPAADIDGNDPGDDKANLAGATPTVLGTPTTVEQTHGPHVLSNNDLFDWYEVTLDASKSYRFHTIGGTGDTYGELFDSPDPLTASTVTFDDDSGGGGQFNLTYNTPASPASNTYYLRVRKFSTSGSSTYSLKYLEF